MNFNDLIIFKTIYEENTINKAAKKLKYTQSNITARLHVIEVECNTALFIRSHNGVIPTIHGKIFYSYAVDTISKFELLKSSFSENLPKLLTSELLFNYLVIETKQINLKATDITCKKTNCINSELNNVHYDSVITFNKLDRREYQLTKIDTLVTSFLCKNKKSYHHLPIFINSDSSCPLRKLTLELINDSDRFIEIDSLENILRLISNGEGISLLPCYLENEGYSRTNSKLFNVEYYSYRYIL